MFFDQKHSYLARKPGFYREIMGFGGGVSPQVTPLPSRPLTPSGLRGRDLVSIQRRGMISPKSPPSCTNESCQTPPQPDHKHVICSHSGGKMRTFGGSDPRSHTSPAVPEHPPTRPSYDLSPKDAGVCFHPTLLPPAPCGGVKMFHHTVNPRSKAWFKKQGF